MWRRFVLPLEELASYAADRTAGGGAGGTAVGSCGGGGGGAPRATPTRVSNAVTEAGEAAVAIHWEGGGETLLPLHDLKRRALESSARPPKR